MSSDMLRKLIEEAPPYVGAAEQELDAKMRAAVGSTDAAFVATILDLAKLPSADFARERRRAAKELGVNCKALDAEVQNARKAGGKEEKEPAQRDELIALAMEHGEFWHNDANRGLCSIRHDDGRVKHYPINSADFRRWLTAAYGRLHPLDTPHGTYPTAPTSQALTDAINALEAHAAEGPQILPKLRIGVLEPGNVQDADPEQDSSGISPADAIYVDLADNTGRAVEVDARGWRIADNPPVRFLRPNGMKALPMPVFGQDALAELKQLLGQAHDIWVLALAWLFGCFAPSGTFPLLVITGEQGSGKTTLARVLRRLIDPNKVDLGAKPKEERDLMIAARNAWVLGFDNMSYIDGELSDAMCRLATGGGFRARQLFTDEEEVLFSASRPQLLNAIPDVARAPDLLDRAILLDLESRADTARDFEADFWRKFEALAPAVLGALLDAVSGALRRLPDTRLASKPRMADFARWVEAAAPELGFDQGEFLAAYEANRQNAARMVAEGELLVAPLRAVLAGSSGSFLGTASELLSRLNAAVDLDIKRARGWPAAPNSLTSGLKRLAPALRRVGIEATQTDRTNRERGKWLIRTVPETAQNGNGGDGGDASFSSVGMPPPHMFEGEL